MLQHATVSNQFCLVDQQRGNLAKLEASRRRHKTAKYKEMRRQKSSEVFIKVENLMSPTSSQEERTFTLNGAGRL